MNSEQLNHLQHAPQQEVLAQIDQVVDALIHAELAPIAKEIIAKYPTESTTSIHNALQSTNEQLQQILLKDIVSSLPFYSKMVVADAVEKLVGHPNLDGLAKQALQSFEP